MEFVLKYVEESCLRRDKSHDFDHSLRVRDFAREIALSMELPEKQVFMVEVVALMHDVNDHKYLDNSDGYYSFLKDNFPETHQSIVDVIERISYSRERKLGRSDWNTLGDFLVIRNVVSDADKLDAIGKNGLIRCIEYTKTKNTDEELIKEDVIKHYHEKLKNLKDFMTTEPGKEKAVEFTEELDELIKDFSKFM